MTYEQFLALAQSRRSVRKFSARPVARADLLRALEAARWAPSNHNRQPWNFIVLEDRHQIAQLAERVGAALSERLKSLPPVAASHLGEFVGYGTFFSEAPVLILVLHKLPVGFAKALLQDLPQPELVSGEPLSAAMSVQNLLLASQALGLGACVLTAPLIVRQVFVGELNLPAGYEFTCLIALGHPDEAPAPPRRKTIEQIAEFRQDAPRRQSQS